MIATQVFGFRESAEQAARLAAELDAPFGEVAVHRFPDGESLVQVDASPGIAILYRSLDDPNAKLVELLLAASALRDNGAKRVLLVAPYLAYMRQDIAFHPGEAVSQRVIGKLLAAHFDKVMTVDPHLHRTRSLEEIMPRIRSASISAAATLSATLDWSARPLLAGPDVESRQWVTAIAAPFELDVLIGAKRRQDERHVEIEFPDAARAAGRPVVLVDDVISSGETLIAAARLLHGAGAAKVEVLATHCLAGAEAIARMHAAGIARIRATDTIPGPCGTIPIAPAIAAELRRRGWIRKR